MGCELRVDWLGRVPYPEALEIQAKCVEARRTAAAPDRLLLLEHPAVITLGRSAGREHVRASSAELRSRGIAVHEVSRGGDVTYHGPGQLVGYPILDLAARGEADVHRYLRSLEEILLEALAGLGVAAETVPGFTGVFARSESSGPARKIASIGVGLRRWITCHGFALNVCMDLAGFDAIVPCGLHGVEMTSVAAESAPGAAPDLWGRARELVARAASRRWS